SMISDSVTLSGSAITTLNSTLVTPPKAIPYTITVAPIAAEPGVNPVTRGSTKNIPPLVAVPPAVVTETAPELAPAGTVSRTCSADNTAKPAATPFTRTELTPPKPVPFTTTLPPPPALPGANPVIVGTT